MSDIEPLEQQLSDVNAAAERNNYFVVGCIKGEFIERHDDLASALKDGRAHHAETGHEVRYQYVVPTKGAEEVYVIEKQ